MSFIGQGRVYHARATEHANVFKYPAYFLLFNVDQEEDMRRTLRGHFHRVLSLRAQDYLDGVAGSIASAARTFLREKLQYEAEEIWLQTMPRILGYGFNPINFWILKKNGTIDAVLCEVNNTFGERHYYFLNYGSETAGSWHRKQKEFHVSPFQPVDGTYDFRFDIREDHHRIDIVYRAPEGHVRLATWIEGDLLPATEVTLFGLLKRYGWMTPVVMMRIHYQAGKLWLNKVPFFRKPLLPKQEITR